MIGDDEEIRSLKDQIAALRRITETQDRMIDQYKKDVETLLTERNAWREGFQQAERLAGLQSVAVDPSSCFPLHERIEATKKQNADMASYCSGLVESGAPLSEKSELDRLQSDMPTVHRRKCRDCGNVAWHADNRTPYVLCRKCGSQDTRLVKDEVTG
jgi:DNA-directed RNA polymerase subunit RPC12/RpoP/chromosome segregation ATPase